MARFHIQLNFASLTIFGAVLGFSAGVISGPIMIMLELLKGSSNELDAIAAIFILFAAPLVGGLNGILMGAIGYPVYRFLSELRPPLFTGRVEIKQQ